MAAPKKRIVIGLLAAALLAGGAWLAYRLSERRDDTIRVSGNIEAIEVAVSFKIPGRVLKRFVDEGDAVREGMPLAELETADLQAEAALRRGELQAAEAALAELLAGSRPDEIAAALAFKEKAEAAHQELENGSRPQEIAASKAEFDGAAADLERLKNDLNRARDLQRNNPGAITPEQLDQANAAFLVGQNRYAQARQRYDMVKEGPRKEAILQARAAREQARAQYRLVKEGPRKEVIDQARARVAQAGAAVQAAETRLGYAAVASPLNGVVLSKNTEPGEYVAPGTPVVTVADIENVWLRAYVDARDIGTRTVVLGSEAEITTDAYPQKVYRGRVSFIASEQEFTPKAVQTNRERVKFVYRIKIDVKNPDKELKPGMPADARIVGPKR